MPETYGELFTRMCQLRDELAAAKAERDAAVADLESLMGSVDSEEACHLCKRDGRGCHRNFGATACRPKWRGMEPERQVIAPADQNAGEYADNPVLAPGIGGADMNIEDTIKVLSNKMDCVKRQIGPGCDRNCAACDIVLPDELVISAYREVVNILSAKQEAEKNEPLTLDELRELGREPVYIVSLGEDFDDGWQLCVGVGGGYAHFLMFYHLLHLNHYGKTWLAYRRPPKEARIW